MIYMFLELGQKNTYKKTIKFRYATMKYIDNILFVLVATQNSRGHPGLQLEFFGN